MTDQNITQRYANGHPEVEYKVQSMEDWSSVDSDLIIVDPPIWD